MKKKAIELLQENRVQVEDVVYELTTLLQREKSQHISFLTHKTLNELEECKHCKALFARLNCYWTYLSPHLFVHIVKKIYALEKLVKDMESYKLDLQQFRIETPLELFCQVEKEFKESPPDFDAVVTTFKERFPNQKAVTLEDVEDFRMEYIKHYKLHDLALMLLEKLKRGSYIISFCVPKPLVEILRQNIPKEVLKRFCISRLAVAEVCVFIESGTTANSSVSPIYSMSPTAVSQLTTAYSHSITSAIVPHSLATPEVPYSTVPSVTEVSHSTTPHSVWITSPSPLADADCPSMFAPTDHYSVSATSKPYSMLTSSMLTSADHHPLLSTADTHSVQFTAEPPTVLDAAATTPIPPTITSAVQPHSLSTTSVPHLSVPLQSMGIREFPLGMPQPRLRDTSGVQCMHARMHWCMYVSLELMCIPQVYTCTNTCTT